MDLFWNKRVEKCQFAGYSVFRWERIEDTVIKVCEKVRKTVANNWIFTSEDCDNCNPTCNLIR